MSRRLITLLALVLMLVSTIFPGLTLAETTGDGSGAEPPQSSGPQVWVGSPEHFVRPGDLLQVQILVKDVPALSELTMTLKYDPNLLAPVLTEDQPLVRPAGNWLGSGADDATSSTITYTATVPVDAPAQSISDWTELGNLTLQVGAGTAGQNLQLQTIAQTTAELSNGQAVVTLYDGEATAIDFTGLHDDNRVVASDLVGYVNRLGGDVKVPLGATLSVARDSQFAQVIETTQADGQTGYFQFTERLTFAETYYLKASAAGYADQVDQFTHNGLTYREITLGEAVVIPQLPPVHGLPWLIPTSKVGTGSWVIGLGPGTFHSLSYDLQYMQGEQPAVIPGAGLTQDEHGGYILNLVSELSSGPYILTVYDSIDGQAKTPVAVGEFLLLPEFNLSPEQIPANVPAQVALDLSGLNVANSTVDCAIIPLDQAQPSLPGGELAVNSDSQATLNLPGGLAAGDYHILVGAVEETEGTDPTPPVYLAMGFLRVGGTTVSGQVTAIDGPLQGNPLPNVKVSLWAVSDTGKHSILQTKTDESGNYSLMLNPSQVSTNRFLLSVGSFFNGNATQAYAGKWYTGPENQSSPGYYERQAGEFILNSGQSSTINFALAQGGIITGHVIDDGSQALASIAIQPQQMFQTQPPQPPEPLRMSEAFTKDDGSYVVVLPAGTYTVRAFGGEQYLDGAYSDEAQQPIQLTIAVGELLSGKDITLLPTGAAGAISGTVIEAGTGSKLANIQVRVEPQGTPGPSWSGITDADGNFAISGITPGSYRVLAGAKEGAVPYATMYYTAQGGVLDWRLAAAVVVTNGQTNNGIDFVLQPSGWINGTVRDSAGNPLADKPVVAMPLDVESPPVANTRTDSNGNYSLILPAGQYYVRMGYIDDAPGALEFWYGGGLQRWTSPQLVVASGDVVDHIDLVYHSTGYLVSGTVTAPGLEHARVVAFDMLTDKPVADTFTQIGGSYAIKLPAGSYWLETDVPNGYLDQTIDLISLNSDLSGQDFALEALVRAKTWPHDLFSDELDNATLQVMFDPMEPGQIQLPTTLVFAIHGEQLTVPVSGSSHQLPDQSYLLPLPQSALPAGYYTVDLFSSEQATTPFAVADFVIHDASTAYVLSGTVTLLGGIPAPAGLPVCAEEVGHKLWLETRTTADGSYSLRLPAGSYRLAAKNGHLAVQVWHDGAFDPRDATAVLVDADTTLNLILQPWGASISLDESANPVFINTGDMKMAKTKLPSPTIVGQVSLPPGVTLLASRLFINPESLDPRQLITAWDQNAGQPLSGAGPEYEGVLSGNLNAPNTVVMVSQVSYGGEELFFFSEPLIVYPDQIAPVISDLQINGGALSTANRSVTVHFSAMASDAVQMRISDSAAGLESATWVTLAREGFTHELASGANGPRRVFLQVRDDVGNISAEAEAEIYYVGAVASGSIVINGGAQYTNSTEVTVGITSPADADQMSISTDPEFSGAEWGSLAQTTSLTLSAVDGSKTVYARFRNSKLGLVSDRVSASIVLDTQDPEISIVGVSDQDLAASFEISFSANDDHLDAYSATLQQGTGEAVPFTGGRVTETGTYTLVVTALDLAGNSSSQTVQFTVDATAPAAPAASGSGTISLSNQGAYVVTGTAEVGSRVKLQVNNETPLETTADEQGSFSFTLYLTDLPDGTVSLSLTATDAVGNTSQAQVLTPQKDATAPKVLSVYSPQMGKVLTAGETFTLNTIVDSAGTVYYSLEKVGGGADPIVAATEMGKVDGQYSANFQVASDLGDTNLVWTIWMVDTFGNQSNEATLQFAVDTVKPSITSVTHTTGVNNYKAGDALIITILGSAEPAAVVTVNLGSYRTGLRAQPTATPGQYQVQWLVPAGVNQKNLQISAAIKDAAGNASAAVSDPVLINLDATAPVTKHIPSAQPNSRGYHTVAPTIKLAVNEPAAVHYAINSGSETIVAADQLILTDGSYVTVPIALSEGIQTIRYWSVDLAGNSEAVRTTSEIRTDATRPAISGVSITDIDREAKTASIVGSISEAGLVEVFRVLGNGGRIPVGQVRPTVAGNWTLSNVPLSAGQNDFAVSAVDSAGNTSLSPVNQGYFLDTRGPVFAITVQGQAITIVADESVDNVSYTLASVVDGQTTTDNSFLTQNGLTWTGTLPVGASRVDFVINGNDLSGNPGVGVYSATMAVTTEDNNIGQGPVALVIPSGALTANTQITVGTTSVDTTAIDNAGNTITGMAEFGPEGTRFEERILVQLPCDPSITDINQLIVLYWDGHSWQDYTSHIIPEATDLINQHVVGFWTDHFSTYASGADTTPPSLAIAGPESGLITNQGSVTVTGTSDGVVKVSVNGGVAAEATMNTGSFSATVALTANQENTITVTASDQAGNEVSQSLTVVIDSEAPSLELTAVGGNTTAADSINITAAVADAHLASLTVGDVTIDLQGQTTASHSFSVQLPSDGNNVITASATDAAGNSREQTITVVRDTNCALTVATPAGGDITATATLNVSGTTDPGATVTVDNLSDQAAAITETALQDGSYSISVTLLQGSNELQISASDALGNDSSVISRTVTYNANVAQISLNQPTSLVRTTTATITGRVTSLTELSSLTYTAPGGNGGITADGDGNFSFVVNLNEGTNTITVLAVNNAGMAQSSVQIISDRTAPVITVSTPEEGQQIATQSLTVAGLLSEAGTVVVHRGSNYPAINTSGASNSFSQAITLTSGENVITVTATDAAGNIASLTRTVTCTYVPSGPSNGGSTTPTTPATHAPEIDASELAKTSTTQNSAAVQTVLISVTVSSQTLQLAAAQAKSNGQPVALTLPAISLPGDATTTADGRPIVRKAELNITDQQLNSLVETGLTVQGPAGTVVELPRELLQAIAGANSGLSLEMQGADLAAGQALVNAWDQVYAAQEISTNFSGRTVLRFAQPAGTIASELKVKVRHSDGSIEDISPASVDGYLQITIDRFSTFVIYKAGTQPAEPVKEIKLTIGQTAASVSGAAYQLDAVPYVAAGNRTMVPVRFVTEALGAKVDWLSATRQVRITDGDTVILLTIGSKVVLVNGQPVTIDAPALNENGRTFVPLRFVSETIGATVTYNPVDKSVVIKR